MLDTSDWVVLSAGAVVCWNVFTGLLIHYWRKNSDEVHNETGKLPNWIF